MAFEDLAEFIRPGFDLPVLGKKYYVPAPNARDGVWLQAVVDAGESVLVAGAVTAANKTVLSDDQERTAYQMAMGTAYDEMLADDVPWPVLKHAAMTAILYWTRGAPLAEAHWARFEDGRGKAATASSPTSSATSPEDQSTPTPG